MLEPRPERPLDTLAAEINAHHRAFVEALRTAFERAILAGNLLIEAKAQVPHGEWLPWLRANFEGHTRTAQGYMQLACHYSLDDLKCETISHFGIRDALDAIAAPRTAPAPRTREHTLDAAAYAAYETTQERRKITVPATIDEAHAHLRKLDRFVTTLHWSRAALIYLSTQVGTTFAELAAAMNAPLDVPMTYQALWVEFGAPDRQEMTVDDLPDVPFPPPGWEHLGDEWPNGQY